MVLALIVVVEAGYLVLRHRAGHDRVDVRTIESVDPSPGSGSTGPTRSAAGRDDSHEAVLGPADAPHTVIVYEDFVCPFCGMFEAASHRRLDALAAAGRVRVSYRPFDLLGGTLHDGRLDPDAWSARATAAFATVLQHAGPAAAVRLHDTLYADQPAETGPFPTTAALARDAVAALGSSAPAAERRTVAVDVRRARGLAWVRSANAAARRAGVEATPTVVVDGRVLTDYRTMDDLADEVVAAVS